MDNNIINEFQLNYIDGILIVDSLGKILYSVRYNPRFGDAYKEDDLNEILGKNFLEVYSSISLEDSSINKCIKEGKAVYLDYQICEDYKGRIITTQNLTLPIIQSGKTVGAIELIKDITTIKDTIKDISIYTKDEKKQKQKKQNSSGYGFRDIITKDPKMELNIEKAKLAAESNSSVLIYGDTGTGKEVFVQSIHQQSSRAKKPFIAQNCAAIPEGIFESILFGSVQGAYTGAADRKGLFEQANGGTLFLDELNSMPINLQAKLLRVLQDGYIRKVGDDKNKKIDVRIIVAMNIEPRKAIKEGQLREDIFYRLGVIQLYLPPLKERICDLEPLMNYFIDDYNKNLNRNVKGVSLEVEKIFKNYDWPGNVRELKHVIEGAMNFVSEGIIDKIHLPIYLFNHDEEGKISVKENSNVSLNDAVEQVEKRIIGDAFLKCKGNISHTAKFLKIPRQTLRYKMKKYGLL